MLDFIVDEYQVDHAVLISDLRKFGIKGRIKVTPAELWYTEPLEKQAHAGFNVLYYWSGDKNNPKLWRWIYGYDIYLELKSRLPFVNFILVDGTQDMTQVFPIIDFYLRPNRHDGSARLRRECEIQNIPYYWSQSDPSFLAAEHAISIIIGIKGEKHDR